MTGFEWPLVTAAMLNRLAELLSRYPLWPDTRIGRQYLTAVDNVWTGVVRARPQGAVQAGHPGRAHTRSWSIRTSARARSGDVASGSVHGPHRYRHRTGPDCSRRLPLSGGWLPIGWDPISPTHLLVPAVLATNAGLHLAEVAAAPRVRNEPGGGLSGRGPAT
jgi:hypothetical protein